MNKMMRRMTGAGLALLAAAMLAPEAKAVATSSATLNIDVTIVSNLSVKVNNVASSTDSVQSWNTSAQAFFASATTATVTNDSGAQTEKWALSTLANSIDQGTAGSWSLAASLGAVGADSFGVQAVFGSATTPVGSCPATGSSDWASAFAPILTAAPVTYTSTTFADTNLNNGGANSFKPDVFSGVGDGRMLAGNKRALCWKVTTPTTTSTIDQQTIMVIVSALNP